MPSHNLISVFRTGSRTEPRHGLCEKFRLGSTLLSLRMAVQGMQGDSRQCEADLSWSTSNLVSAAPGQRREALGIPHAVVQRAERLAGGIRF